MAKRILSSQAICFLFLFGCLNGDFACAQVFVTSQVGVFFANESIEWQAEIQGADRPTSVEWSLAWKETIIHKGKQKTSRNAPGRNPSATNAASSLAESVESALALGQGVLHVAYPRENVSEPKWPVKVHSQHFACDGCGRSFHPLTPHSFSFNSQLGWCRA